MTPPTVPVDKSVMVGSVHESTQDVRMPDIHTVTHAKSIRVPRWVVPAAVVVVMSDGYWGGILRDLVVTCLDAI